MCHAMVQRDDEDVMGITEIGEWVRVVIELPEDRVLVLLYELPEFLVTGVWRDKEMMIARVLSDMISKGFELPGDRVDSRESSSDRSLFEATGRPDGVKLAVGEVVGFVGESHEETYEQLSGIPPQTQGLLVRSSCVEFSSLGQPAKLSFSRADHVLACD